MDKGTKGFVSFVETLGGLDGPGLRTVFFLQGCPARCIYCHNPETHSFEGGVEYDVQKILDTVDKYKAYYGAHGGVTFSGGEPLVQRDFVIAAAKALKQNGIHTALDTSGILFDSDVYDAVDLVLLDIKHTDRNKYKQVIGVDFEIDNTFKILEYFDTHNIKFWVRQVIVPGINDDRQNISELKRLAKNAQRIELLPYHAMAKNKYQKLGIPYPDYLQEPSKELMETLNAWLKD